MNSTPLEAIGNVTSASLVDQALQIALLIPSWKAGGDFFYQVPQAPKLKVDVFTKNSLNNDFWVARNTAFGELSVEARRKMFDTLMEYAIGLVSDIAQAHTQHEMGYIHELVDFKATPYDLGEAAPDYDVFTYLVELDYQLQFPLKKRKFCNLVHIARHQDGNSGYVVSLAVDPKLVGLTGNPGFVNGRYTSVELVKWDPKTESLDWRMATCSDAGGNVPQWLAKLSIKGVVAKDVPSFLKWCPK